MCVSLCGFRRRLRIRADRLKARRGTRAHIATTIHSSVLHRTARGISPSPRNKPAAPRQSRRARAKTPACSNSNSCRASRTVRYEEHGRWIRREATILTEVKRLVPRNGARQILRPRVVLCPPHVASSPRQCGLTGAQSHGADGVIDMEKGKSRPEQAQGMMYPRTGLLTTAGPCFSVPTPVTYPALTLVKKLHPFPRDIVFMGPRTATPTGARPPPPPTSRARRHCPCREETCHPYLWRMFYQFVLGSTRRRGPYTTGVKGVRLAAEVETFLFFDRHRKRYAQ